MRTRRGQMTEEEREKARQRDRALYQGEDGDTKDPPKTWKPRKNKVLKADQDDWKADEEREKRKKPKPKATREEKPTPYRRKMAAMRENDPVKYREYLDRHRFNALKKIANMTEEEKREANRKKYLERQRRKLKLSVEEIERRKQLKKEAELERRRKWEATATPEEKEFRRVSGLISKRRKNYWKQLTAEGLGEEEMNKNLREMEDSWWKDYYPGGKPHGLERKISRPIWMPGMGPISSNGRKRKKSEVKVFKFICFRCSPTLLPDKESLQFVGYDKKPSLIKHLEKAHKGSYFKCKKCSLLKYSKQSLNIHLKFCLKK